MGETRRHEFRYYVAVYFFFGVFTPPIIRVGGLFPPKKSYPRASEELKLSNKMNAESGEKTLAFLWIYLDEKEIKIELWKEERENVLCELKCIREQKDGVVKEREK